MKTIEKIIHFGSRTSAIKLWHLTDWHVGAKAFDEERFKRDVQTIADDPDAYWLGGGDALDAICRRDDKRYQPDTLASWLNGVNDVIGHEQEYAQELIRPIASKCVGIVGGNHEQAALQYYDRDIYWSMTKWIAQVGGLKAEEIGLGYQGFIRLLFRRGRPENFGNSWAFNIRMHHGYGGGTTVAAGYNALYKAMREFGVDLSLFGHRHIRAFADEVVPVPDRSSGGWRDTYRAGMFSASYLNAFVQPSNGTSRPVDTYSSRAGYTPKVLGAMPIIFYPQNREMLFTAGNANPARLLA